MNSPKLSIVVVSLDNPEYFELLMQGLIRNTANPFEVLLHINVPSQQFINVAEKWLKTKYLTLYSRSPENSGVSRPSNRLFQDARGEYFTFLDDDVYPSPGWDKALLDKIDSNISCQYLSPTLYQPIDAQFPGAEKDYNITSFGKDIENFDINTFNTSWKISRNITKDSQGVCGNFFMKASLWNELNGYDDKLFRGYDVDLKLRAWQLGMQKYKGSFEFKAVADSCLYHFAHIGHNKLGFSESAVFNHTFQSKWNMTPGEFWQRVVDGHS